MFWGQERCEETLDQQCELIGGLSADLNNLNLREVQTGNCRVDCGVMQARARPQQAPKRKTPPPPPPRAVKLLLPTCSFNIKLTCDLQSETLCCECAHLFPCKNLRLQFPSAFFFYPKYSHLLYFILHVKRVSCCIAALNKQGISLERGFIQWTESNR